ncbi:AAA family ATPase [Candidatus Riflebacteria bacterium]
MSDSPTGIKMKFCESLDRFVAIRFFSPDQVQNLFRNTKITDKKSYKRLIINASVVNYLDEIAPLVFGNSEYPLLGEIIEQELYNLCIKVNPSLDIKEVTIQLDETSKSKKEIPLLDQGNEKDSPLSDEIRDFLQLEDILKKRIVGQDMAVKAVSEAIRKAKVGLKNPKKPVGCFVFVGQTGVGKTELAKAICEFYSGSENDMVRIDCSEFAMSHEYAKLIGAPPGYIGHSDGGFLTEAVKRKSKTVVIFDEVEKAHEKVHNLLLQLLDEGILTDSKGTIVSFRETIIILTTNIGVTEITQEETRPGFRPAPLHEVKETGEADGEISFEKKAAITRKAMAKKFPPEFLNRLDDIIVFRALTKNDNMKIISIMLEEVHSRVQNLNMAISFSNSVKSYLVDEGTNIKLGARPLKRTIHQKIENPLAEAILRGKFKKQDAIDVQLKNDKILFKKKTRKSKKSKKA